MNIQNQPIVGIEMEQHRTSYAGDLSQKKAPVVSEISEGFVTTDFSESQAEVVTHPADGIKGALNMLKNVKQNFITHLEDEMLWPSSLPPRLPSYEKITLAQSGQKDPVFAKEYRQKLIKNYGVLRMLISGIHINISFPEWNWGNQDYMNASRQFLQDRWLLIYLYGASPVTPPEYSGELFHCVPSPWHKGTCLSTKHPEEIYRYATSLRMSCFGYPPQPQSQELLSFASIESYTSAVDHLIQEGGVLQQESEIYLPIRLKSLPEKGETMNSALKSKGIHYVELRTMDRNPLTPLGIDENEIKLQQLVLMYGQAKPLAPDNKDDRQRWHQNHHSAALMGRNPSTQIRLSDQSSHNIKEAALNTLEDLANFSKENSYDSYFAEAIEDAFSKVEHPETLPSSIIYEASGEYGENFYSFMTEQGKNNYNIYMNQGSK